MAHGRTAEVDIGVDALGEPDLVDPDWLSTFSNDAAAQRYFDDAYAIMETLQKASGLHPSSLAVIASGSTFEA
jgi:hypothetical protein